MHNLFQEVELKVLQNIYNYILKLINCTNNVFFLIFNKLILFDSYLKLLYNSNENKTLYFYNDASQFTRYYIYIILFYPPNNNVR